MGYGPGTIPEPFPETIDEILSSAHKYCNIEGGYLTTNNISLIEDSHLLVVEETPLDIKKIIFHQLKRADKLALFACTAGPEIGEWSKKIMSEGDMIKGYIVDVVGSEIVEMAMDKVQAELSLKMTAEGLKITNRYSPGYCNWSVAEQHKLFSLLPHNFCNIQLTEAALMYPIKSVSGIIGIGKNVRFNPYTCQLCDSKNCPYRNRKS
jgi:hypothetical protein